MLRRSLKIIAAIAIGGLFLWLAFRNVRLEELWEYSRQISFGWILPLALTSLGSHFLRAERWRLLIEHDKKDLDSITLISGVMTGYLLNIVGPRLGEVSRPLYVAKREGLSSSKLMGTIVLERIIDLATLAFLMLVVSVYLIADMNLLRQIFGDGVVQFVTEGYTPLTVFKLLGLVIVMLGMLYFASRMLQILGRRFQKVGIWVEKIEKMLKMFWKGLLSIREVRRWWLFIFYTLLIWLGYTLMTYIPFWMFDMQEVYNLGMLDALVITVISAIGIAIPSPGGIGTYHYFVKQSLLVLFAVPAVTGLAYATITHAAMILIVCAFTPIFLAIDKFRGLKSEAT